MGRNEEGYTEDTYLMSRIAEAIVRGTQGKDISAPDKTVALLTDFPTQSEPLSGLERGAITLSDRMLRRDILPPWTAAITKNGALGVMAGYPDIEDMPAHGSKKWMNDVLRDELGFKGIVVSEGEGFGTLIYEDIVPTQKEAGALALRAGVDINITYEAAYMGALIESVKEGGVPMVLIDRAVRRMLELKFRLGLFEHPYVDVGHAKQVMHSKENQQLALDAARGGIVLLKNENNGLPLRKNLKSVAIVGPNANSASNLFGDYSAQVVLQHVDTVLDAIKAKVSPATRVVYAEGCAVNDQNKNGFDKAVQAAKNADVAIVVLGEQSRREGFEAKHRPAPTDGEGYDVASLDLTGVQEDLLQAIRATGTPTVLILINGRPLSIRWAAEQVPAIVEAWQPGERGAEAIADVLFGDYNPSARLPITIPRSVGQLPAYYSYPLSKAYWIEGGWTDTKGYVDMPATPLYPFGYGLSYTNFRYSNLRTEPLAINSDGKIKVSVDVENSGKRPGIETVQMYLRERFTPVATPVKQLRGFEKVQIDPGQKKTVNFMLGPEELQLLDQELHWKVVPGTFDVMVGKSSTDIVLTGSFEVKSSGSTSNARLSR